MRVPFDQTRRGEIYALICDYAATHRSLPNTNAIYTRLVKPAIPICRNTFHTHFTKLIRDGLIEIDPATKAVSVGPSELTILE